MAASGIAILIANNDLIPAMSCIGFAETSWRSIGYPQRGEMFTRKINEIKFAIFRS